MVALTIGSGIPKAREEKYNIHSTAFNLPNILLGMARKSVQNYIHTERMHNGFGGPVVSPAKTRRIVGTYLPQPELRHSEAKGTIIVSLCMGSCNQSVDLSPSRYELVSTLFALVSAS